MSGPVLPREGERGGGKKTVPGELSRGRKTKVCLVIIGSTVRLE